MRRILPPVIMLACIALGWQIGGADRYGAGSLEAAEGARLRAHFAKVEQELLARDVSALSPKQQTARAEQIRRLRAYAASGQFPRNEFHPGVRVPYFRDARGNLCAMAYLIAASGRGDIVDRIARTRNYAYIPDLVDEPGLAGWLADNGLTVAEAARIQPAYDGPCLLCEPTPVKKPSAAYLGATAVATGLSGISLALNARSVGNLSTGEAAGLLGIGAGVANLVLGFARIDEPGWRNGAAVGWNLAVGSLTTFLGIRALDKRPEAARLKAASRVSIVPVTQLEGRPAVGFHGTVRF